MNALNNDIRELDINELDDVVGGGDISNGAATAVNVLTTTFNVGEKVAAVMLTLALGGTVTVK